MCTLSWKPAGNGYVLFFNRDESRKRSIAQAPRVQQSNGVSYLAPTDPVAGGTWLLVNEYGITIGLLNNYDAPSSATISNASSRGLLPLICSDCASVAQAVDRVMVLPLNDYLPFHLVVAAVNEAGVLSWDGSARRFVALDPLGEMRTTSMFKPQRVAKIRAEILTNLIGDMSRAKPEQLRSFHWYAGDDAATSVRMSRPDACTHSISEITVSMDQKVAHFEYSPLAGIQGDEPALPSGYRRIPPSTSIFLPFTKSFSMMN